MRAISESRGVKSAVRHRIELAAVDDGLPVAQQIQLAADGGSGGALVSGEHHGAQPGGTQTHDRVLHALRGRIGKADQSDEGQSVNRGFVAAADRPDASASTRSPSRAIASFASTTCAPRVVERSRRRRHSIAQLENPARRAFDVRDELAVRRDRTTP